MNPTNNDGPTRSPTSNTQGSGSDTASAANISAGTSVGNAGQPAMPHAQSASTGQGGNAGGQGGGGGAMPRTSGQSAGATGTGTTTSGNVGERMQGAAGAARQAAGDLSSRAGDALDQASDRARDIYQAGTRQLDQARDRSAEQFRQARGGIERFVSENPMMVGVMGLAAGLVIGALLPRTRQENRMFGRWADEVRDQGMRYARDAAQRGREYVEDALGSDEGGADAREGDWRSDDEGRGAGGRPSGPRYQNH